MAPTQNSGKRAGRPENLKPFPKGISGNPGGRPRKITSRIERVLASRVVENGKPTKKTYLDLFAEVGVKRAIARSDVLYKEIYERVEGPVERTQIIREQITGGDGGPVKISAEHFHLMLCQFYGIPVTAEERHAALSLPGAVAGGPEPAPDSE